MGKVIAYIFFGIILIIFRIGICDESFEEHEKKIVKLIKKNKNKKFFEDNYYSIENTLKENEKKLSKIVFRFLNLSVLLIFLNLIEIKSIEIIGITITDITIIKIVLPVLIYYYLFLFMHLYIYQNDLDTFLSRLTRILYPDIYFSKLHDIIKPFFLWDRITYPFSNNFVGMMFKIINVFFFWLFFAGIALFPAGFAFKSLDMLSNTEKYLPFIKISKVLFIIIMINLVALVTYYRFRHGYYRGSVDNRKKSGNRWIWKKK